MSKRIQYPEKTNPRPVIDRTKQSTADDFNEIKEVVNSHAKEIEELPGFDRIPPVINNLTSPVVNASLSASQGVVLKAFIDSILAILNSNDTTLDELQEIVNFIKQNKEDLQKLNIDSILGVGNVSNKNLIFQSTEEQELVFQRLGTFGDQVNPQIKLGRMVLGGIPEAKIRWLVKDDAKYLIDTAFFEMEGSGTVSSVRQKVGSNYEAFIGMQSQPTFRLATTDLDAGDGIIQSSRLELGSGEDNPTDVFLERLGPNQLGIILSGSAKRIFYADSEFKPSGIVDAWQETPDTPSTPGEGIIKVYNKNGVLTQLNSAGVETPLIGGNSGSSSGLELLTENGVSFWALKGQDPANYGNRGEKAIDFSLSSSPSESKGATGIASVAFGTSDSSGLLSFAANGDNNAAGDYSTSFNIDNESGGDASFAAGEGNSSPSYAEMAVGMNGTNYTPESKSVFSPKDRMFNVGNGSSNTNKSDAFSVFKNGASVFHPTQKSLITNPLAGTFILDSEDSNMLKFYDGNNWRVLNTSIE